MKSDIPSKWQPKKTGMGINFVSDYINIKSKVVKRVQEG
jgi:hypothetical protein